MESNLTSQLGFFNISLKLDGAKEKFAVCVYPNITRSVSECWQAGNAELETCGAHVNKFSL